MKIKETVLWPTKIWEVEDLFDEQFNTDLLKELLEWRKEFGPWTGLYPNHFNSDKPLINVLRNKFMEIAQEITKPLFGDSWSEIVHKFSKGWLLESPPGSQTGIHPHDNAAMAIVYYLQADEKAGDLVLVDPRRGTDITNVGTACDKCIKFTPKVGKLIIIPGYVLHQVYQNNSDRTRYSFACNLVLTNPSKTKDY